MPPGTAFAFLILLVTCYFSYRGITNYAFLDRYSFKPKEILAYKEYIRLLSSGFLHGGWMHLAFNMITMYSFSGSLGYFIGVGNVALIYFTSLLAGNLFALFIHRHKSDYSAVGASGAVAGLVFASVALFPDIRVGILFLPYQVPGWAYALLYMAYTLYGIRSQNDNIGHEAHLGGGVAGLLVVMVKYPEVLDYNLLTIAIILLPTVVLLSVIISNPAFLIVGGGSGRRKFETVEDKFHTQRRKREEELDRLLDKIATKGMSSLTKQEQQRLEELSS